MTASMEDNTVGTPPPNSNSNTYYGEENDTSNVSHAISSNSNSNNVSTTSVSSHQMPISNAVDETGLSILQPPPSYYQQSPTVLGAATPLQQLTPNPNATTAQDQSYDYYMEAHNRTLGTVEEPPTVPPSPSQAPPNHNGNGNDNDDTFEDLWRDEMEEGMGDYAEGEDESVTEVQRRNWKASVAAAMARQFHVSPVKPQRLHQSASVTSMNEVDSIVSRSSAKDEQNKATSTSNANSGASEWFSPIPVPNTMSNTNTHHQRAISDEDEEGSLPSISQGPSPIKPTTTSSVTSTSQHNINNNTPSPAENRMVLLSNENSQRNGSRPPLPLRERPINVTPSRGDATTIGVDAKKEHRVIRATKSSPPDPPSHMYAPKPPKLTTNNNNTHSHVQDKHRIPNAVPGQQYYDPEENTNSGDGADDDDDDDDLTNLVITVVGLEDGQEEPRYRRRNTDTSLLPPSMNGDVEEVDGDDEVSRFLNTTAAQYSEPTSEGIQTAFLTADPASGMFLATFVLLWLPIVLMALTTWDLINTEKEMSVENWRLMLNIPMNEDVDARVRMAQLCLLLLWVLLVKQISLVSTTTQFVGLLCSRRSKARGSISPRPQIKAYANMSFLHRSFASVHLPGDKSNLISKGRWIVGTLLEWIKHTAYMINAWLVLMQATDSVMQLVWNMAALEFISQLDTLAYHVWSLGQRHFRSGATIMLTTPTAPTASRRQSHSRHVTANNSNSKSYRPQQSPQRPWLGMFLYFLVSAVMLLGYGVTIYEQVLGHPAVTDCPAILAQFGEITTTTTTTSDTTAHFMVSFYNGIYARRQGKFIRHHGRYIYDYYSPPASSGDPKAKIAYCRSLEAWTLSLGEVDPCRNYFARTTPTKSYDILNLHGSSESPVTWLVASNSNGADEALLDGVDFSCAKGASSSFALSRQEMSVANQPCRKLTWDTRHGPFPDITWYAPSSTTTSNALSKYEENESAERSGGVDASAMFDVLVTAKNEIMWERQHQMPIYASHLDSQVVLMVFVGRKWALFLLRTPGASLSTWRSHPERHVDRIKELWRHLENNWANEKEGMPSKQIEFVPLFVSESINISERDVDPVGLKWYNIQHDAKSVSSVSLNADTPIKTTLLCASCQKDSNPCHHGGFCNVINSDDSNSGSGQCICRTGFQGALCESSGFGCHEDDMGGCFHGSCKDGKCDCPDWERNGKSFPIRGEACEILPNCWEFEDDGLACFGKGTCSNEGCDHAGTCQMDGTCSCDDTSERSSNSSFGRYTGKLCQQEANCWDYEEDGKDCVANNSCSNAVCRGGICSSDGSCQDCPPLSSGRFCQLLPDCYTFEVIGAQSDCFENGDCSNLGCANGGECQRDGTCSCPSLSTTESGLDFDRDPFDDDFDKDDDTVEDANDAWFSGKLCQIQHSSTASSTAESGNGGNGEARLETNAPHYDEECKLSACEVNGGTCSSAGCECPSGLSGPTCEVAADCFDLEADGYNCFALGTCRHQGCRFRTENSTATCRPDGNCLCGETEDEEVYGKLCQMVLPIDDCFVAEPDGFDCFKKGSCTNVGCSNDGRCTEDGSCDCPSLFWGKQCQHVRFGT